MNSIYYIDLDIHKKVIAYCINRSDTLMLFSFPLMLFFGCCKQTAIYD